MEKDSETVFTYDTWIRKLPKGKTKSNPVWKSKTGKLYQKDYCSLCEVDIVICPKCENSSCNGGGCDYCEEDFKEWLQRF